MNNWDQIHNLLEKAAIFSNRWKKCFLQYNQYCRLLNYEATQKQWQLGTYSPVKIVRTTLAISAATSSGLGVPDCQERSASLLQVLAQAVFLRVRKSGKLRIIACSRDCSPHMKLALLFILIRRQEISRKRTGGMKNEQFQEKKRWFKVADESKGKKSFQS